MNQLSVLTELEIELRMCCRAKTRADRDACRRGLARVTRIGETRGVWLPRVWLGQAYWNGFFADGLQQPAKARKIWAKLEDVISLDELEERAASVMPIDSLEDGIEVFKRLITHYLRFGDPQWE